MTSDSTVYLDNNGSTPLTPPVLRAMKDHLAAACGNSGAGHPDGVAAREAIEGAAAKVAGAIGAKPGEIFFTSGGTESNNLAVFGLVDALRLAGDRRRHIVCGRHEHMSVIRPIEELERRGYRVTWVHPGACGRLSESALEAAIRPDTALVTLMFANNETGILQPVREMARLAREAGAISFVDGVCGAGKLPVDVQEIGCDVLSLSGHKLHAPKGVGALYVREGIAIEAQILGCGQQRGIRSGTENTMGAVALGAAAEAHLRGPGAPDPVQGEVRALCDELWVGLSGLHADPQPVLNGNGPRLPGTLSVWFPGFDSVTLERRLGEAGLSVKAQAAVDPDLPKSRRPSHVLKSMGASDARATESLRISLSSTTTREDIRAAVEIFQAVWGQREIQVSPQRAEAPTL